ncbi:MAG: hypothetical protein LBM00_10330 [Deltaproteobacteria bacterium]|jgi:hypothetical protein|nr:hypothetical protein [Deltaproteobacteria bacterium]
MLIRSANIPVFGLLFSLLGLAWSVFFTVGIGTDAVCVTSGCAVVENERIAGISPWWVADALFFLMALFAVLRLRVAAHFIAALFLAGDCVFLALMLFLAPCASCLVLALLLFCAFVFLSAKNAGFLVKTRRFFHVALSLIWLFLFVMNLGPVVGDVAGSKLLYGSPEAEIDLYFSPTCPACLEALRFFAESANFYAVAENDEDIAILADLTRRLTEGQSLEGAMESISSMRATGTYAAPALTLMQELPLRFAVMRNKAGISRLGFTTVPVILFRGLPQNWVDRGRQSAAPEPGGTPGYAGPDLPPDLSEKPLECGPGQDASCP